MSRYGRGLDSIGHEMDSDIVSVSSGGSMSDYASDQEDVEMELGRDKIRQLSFETSNIVKTDCHRYLLDIDGENIIERVQVCSSIKKT